MARRPIRTGNTLFLHLPGPVEKWARKEAKRRFIPLSAFFRNLIDAQYFAAVGRRPPKTKAVREPVPPSIGEEEICSRQG